MYFSREQIWTFRSSRSQMFFKVGVIKNSAIFAAIPVLDSVFNNVAGQKRLQHRSFLLKFAKCSIAVFLLSHLR